VEFASKGFQGTGFEVDESKADQINSGNSYIGDVPSRRLKEVVDAKRLRATTDFSYLRECDAIIICVPTPLRKTKEPDVSYILAAAEQIAKNLRRGHLIILESTTYPGTTDEVLLPMFEEKGQKLDEDFLLAFSPERVDPGNPQFLTHNIPKVVGGVTDDSTVVAAHLYSQIVNDVHAVSSARVAEAAKLLENTFRAVNIGMANEMARLCYALNIDTWEVIRAAATKPFGFMPFYPGPGLGGHCIPIDPFYLTWKSREYELPTRFIELAGEINTGMPRHVIGRVAEALDIRSGKALSRSKVLVVGLAYKKNVPDIRESPSLKLIELIQERGGEAAYYDPHVAEIPKTREYSHLMGMKSVAWDKQTVSAFDAVLVATDHDNVDYAALCEWSPLIIDTRNVFARRDIAAKHIIKA
jgi:UDP-N-acetyl-D-glucosamine dehydrogenase